MYDVRGSAVQLPEREDTISKLLKPRPGAFNYQAPTQYRGYKSTYTYGNRSRSEIPDYKTTVIDRDTNELNTGTNYPITDKQ